MYFEIYTTFLLLLFCCIVLTLLDLAVAGVFAWLSDISFGKVFLKGLFSLLIPVALMLYGMFIGRNWYQVREVDIEPEALPESFEGFRIAQISDIHLRSFSRRRKSLARAIARINGTSPDIVCFTGDLISLDVEELDGFEEILSGIEAPVYCVLGNHDYHIYGRPDSTREEGVEELKHRELSLGWHLLNNGNEIIARGSDSLAVIGVENTSTGARFPSRGDLRGAMSGTDGCFRILLSHDPTHWDAEVRGKDIPLMLSGHTHTMQFSIFGWSPSRYLYRQYRGLYRDGEQFLYVNIGLGETMFPFRLGARPEITLITLK